MMLQKNMSLYRNQVGCKLVMGGEVSIVRSIWHDDHRVHMKSNALNINLKCRRIIIVNSST